MERQKGMCDEEVKMLQRANAGLASVLERGRTWALEEQDWWTRWDQSEQVGDVDGARLYWAPGFPIARA